MFDVTESDQCGLARIRTSARVQGWPPAVPVMQPGADGDGTVDGRRGEIGAARHDHRNVRGARGRHAAGRVFDRDGIERADVQCVQNLCIDFRVGFFAMHVFAADNGGEPVRPACAKMHLHQRCDIDPAGGGNPHAHAARAALLDQLAHTLAQRQARARYEVSVKGILFRVDRARQRFALAWQRRRISAALHVVPQTLTAAGDAQQVAIVGVIPTPRQIEHLERQIECHPVAVALGLGQGAIDIPYQCLGLLFALCFQLRHACLVPSTCSATCCKF